MILSTILLSVFLTVAVIVAVVFIVFFVTDDTGNGKTSILLEFQKKQDNDIYEFPEKVSSSQKLSLDDFGVFVNKIEPAEKSKYVLFQTYHNRKLPKSMALNVVKNQNAHKGFEFHLLDDQACIDFLEDNFPEEVLEAFLSLIPGAFKADLFRLCYLFVKAPAIYMDISMQTMVPLQNLIYDAEEALGEDFIIVPNDCNFDSFSLYNGFLIVSKAGNIAIGRSIDGIVKRVQNRYVPRRVLDLSGPAALGHDINDYYDTQNMPFEVGADVQRKLYILENMEGYVRNASGGKILKTKYSNWKKDRGVFPHYSELVTQGILYYEHIKSDKLSSNVRLFQTWESHRVLPGMKEAIYSWTEDKVDHIVMDACERRQFICDNFQNAVLEAYDGLIPNAYKADLWRYCVLFKCGGIYIDADMMKNKGCDISLASLFENYDFVSAHDVNPRFMYNAFIICHANCPVMKACIDAIVENVRHKIYPSSDLEITGPGLLAECYAKHSKLLVNTLFFKNNGDSMVDETQKICDCSYPDYKKEAAMMRRCAGTIQEAYGKLFSKKRIYSVQKM